MGFGGGHDHGPGHGHSGMRGGAWASGMPGIGGVTRTFGLQHHFGHDREEFHPTNHRATLKRVMTYFRPYRRKWLIILLCILCTSVLSVLPPKCVAVIVDNAIPAKDGMLLALMACAMFGLAIVNGLFGVIQQTLAAKVGQSIVFDMRNELYRRLQLMSLHFYTSTRSGDIVSRINNDTGAVQGVTSGTIVQIATNICLLVSTSVMMFSMNWRLTLLAVSVVPLFYLPSKIVGGIRRRLSTETQESQATMVSFLNERLHVGGSLLMNIFGQRKADAGEFTKINGHLRELNVRQTIVGRWLFMILSVFSAAGPAAVYWYGGFEAMAGQMTVGNLIAFAALLGLLYRPLMQLSSVYVDIQGAFGVFERIFGYLDMQPEVQDKPDAAEVPAARGHIAFDEVSFAYPPPVKIFRKEEEEADDDKPRFALEKISFQIEPGQRVALVGPSGSGKTTITYLLPRFYDPESGRITLDARDLRDLRQESLRAHIGMVTQETFLFHTTIRENLLYAKPGASSEEIIAACKSANIHEFIEALPEGYETVVGERGFRLSGGEKQRLSIARALLKNPSILILDEATSSLDATSEALIQAALEKLLKGRTSLIIAHRLSTILSCDKIIVMENGHIVDAGRHEELLQRHGLYAKLFEQQFEKVLATRAPLSEEPPAEAQA